MGLFKRALGSLLGTAGQGEPSVTGVRADEGPDEDAIYRAALARWAAVSVLEARRQTQEIRFARGPVCVTFAADQHLGGDGCDIEWAFAEAELIAETPGMYIGLVGDETDNFVWPSLLPVRLIAQTSIPDEWALLRRYLRVLAPKLVLSVAGNHQNWTRRLVGVDYFREVLASIRPACIYDTDDARVRLSVGGVSWMLRIRHKWAGSSIYNPTHGIERAAKWDADFTIGIGAHTHTAGVVRTFNVGGRNGLAAMCGPYKRCDEYAKRGGFPKPNQTAAIALLFDGDTGSVTGFDNLQMAARVMRALQ